MPSKKYPIPRISVKGQNGLVGLFDGIPAAITAARDTLKNHCVNGAEVHLRIESFKVKAEKR